MVQDFRKRRSLRRRLAMAAVVGAVLYVLVAYLVMPLAWRRYTEHHPAMEDVPGITQTGNGIPGDPINVALIGTDAEMMRVLVAAGWFPADPLSLRSCLEIAEASVLQRPYDDAPVSSLYLLGRKEDLAFEQPVGNSPRHRHHVRFWRSHRLSDDGRTVWVGSAVYDAHVGLSRTTGQITHVTAADVDQERDYLFQCLEQTHDLAELYWADDFHTIRKGRNGGGDPWETDGRLRVGIIASGSPASQKVLTDKSAATKPLPATATHVSQEKTTSQAAEARRKEK